MVDGSRMFQALAQEVLLQPRRAARVAAGDLAPGRPGRALAVHPRRRVVPIRRRLIKRRRVVGGREPARWSAVGRRRSAVLLQPRLRRPQRSHIDPQRLAQHVQVVVALHRVGDVVDEGQDLGRRGRLRLGIPRRQLRRHNADDVIDHRPRLGQQPRPGRRVGANEVVRVLPLRQRHDANVGLQPPLQLHQPAGIERHLHVPVERLPRQLQTAQRRLGPRRVGVKGQHKALG